VTLQTTADYHVVKGILDRAGGDEKLHPLIHLVISTNGSIFDELSRQHDRLFTTHPGVLSSKGSRIVSVQDADAVLTIGGAAATYRAGLATLVARKTLVPVASFGAASRALLVTLLDSGKVKNKDKVEFGNWGKAGLTA
jgi:hypothetical protein